MFFFIEGDAPENKPAFESIKRINEYGEEYWTARELQTALGYKQWRQFKDTIVKAILSYTSSNGKPSDHFADVRKTIKMPKGATKEIDDYHLSRYACYLIAMNGDPRKKEIALAQSYFAIKTRQRELLEQYEALSEDAKRLAVREDIRRHNKSLAQKAHKAGVIQPHDYAQFQNAGYMGLYNGETENDIHKRKGLQKGQRILDYMGSTELAANLFRITQADEKLKRENIQTREGATAAHFDVGREVRDTIKRLGGTMPENLPTPDKSVNKIGQSQKKRLPKKGDKP